MTTKPRRAHYLTIELGADTKEDMIAALEAIIFDLHRGSTQVTSGGYSSGWTMSYHADESITHDAYFEQVDAWLKDREASHV